MRISACPLSGRTRSSTWLLVFFSMFSEPSRDPYAIHFQSAARRDDRIAHPGGERSEAGRVGRGLRIPALEGAAQGISIAELKVVQASLSACRPAGARYRVVGPTLPGSPAAAGYAFSVG